VVQAAFAVKDQLVLPNVCYEDVFGEEIALQLRSSGAPGHDAAQRVQPGLVRRIDRDSAAPADFADAFARDRPPDAARHQYRRHRRHRWPRPGRRQRCLTTPRAVLSAQVQGMGGMTPFIRFGNYLLLALARWRFCRRMDFRAQLPKKPAKMT
jgi:apolipoprotein N-acyltransferase